MKRSAVSVCIVVLLAGCTSKESRGMQEIRVETSPSLQAACTIKNNAGSWYAITPGTTQVRRTRDPLVIHCEHMSYIGQAQIPSSPNAWMAVASTVDGFTGPLYAYPDRIVIPMTAR